jgi:glycosyltransferase involved in cell wall biosynthesis
VKIAILALEPVAGWGGSEELWADTARAALRAGHQVWFTPRHDPNGDDRVTGELQAGGAVIVPRASRSGPDGSVTAEAIPSHFEAVAQDADVLFVSVGGSVRDLLHPAVAHLIKQASTPVAATIQLTRETELLGDQARGAAREILTSLGALVVPAHRSISVLERAIAARLEHAVVIPSPIKPDLPGALPWPQITLPTLACVARLSPVQKGHDLLLEVLSDGQWKARDWHLNLVGRGLADRYLAELASFYGLSDRVTLTGFQRDMRTVWERNHLLVLPSREETMPIAIMEAMYCARPCLVTDVGDSARMITDSVNGFIAEGDRPRALAAALERAWQHRSEWPAIGQRAYETYTSQRDPAPGETTLALLEALLHGQHGLPR